MRTVLACALLLRAQGPSRYYIIGLHKGKHAMAHMDGAMALIRRIHLLRGSQDPLRWEEAIMQPGVELQMVLAESQASRAA
eukprot:784122-Pyramimonas_sp.AAC.1